MSITININGLTLCHRGSGGETSNTLPDVCKTPSKAIPRPFSNKAYSKDLAQGTTTVFADGGNMIANFGSIFAKSSLDGGGSFGGILSGTFLAEAEFMTHSFDVFFESKPACRLTDKMWMNHKNTVNMAGLKQKKLKNKQLQDWVCECQAETKTHKSDGTAKTCMQLGTDQHQCVEDKKAADTAQREKAGQKAKHGQEKGYRVKDGKIDKVDDIATRRAENPARLRQAHDSVNRTIDQHTRVRRGVITSQRMMGGGGRAGGGVGRSTGGLEAAGDAMAEGILNKQIREATEGIAKAEKQLAGIEKAMLNPNNVPRHAGHTYPDGAILDKDGKITELSEYKFVCPKGTPTGKTNKGTGQPSVSVGESEGPWGSGQQDKYERLQKAMIADGTAHKDVKIEKYSSADCNKKKPAKKGKR